MATEKKVTMSGKEYLDYLKYRDQKNKEFNQQALKLTKTKGFKVAAWTLGIFLVIMAIMDILTPAQPTSFNWTWEGILMFLAVCAGFSWLIHGFGFLLVRR